MAKKRTPKDEPIQTDVETEDEFDDDDMGSEESDYDGSLRIRNESGDLIESDNGDLDDDDEEDDDDDAVEMTLAPSDDPVRQYLKEIGQVPLLNSNQEMWLSTMIAAERLIEQTIDRLSTVKNEDGEVIESLPLPAPTGTAKGIAEHICANWVDVTRNAADYDTPPPDLRGIVDEAQVVFENWNVDSDSYVRQYLRQNDWGRDENWTELARRLFDVFQGIYLMPFDVQLRVLGYYKECE